MLLESARAEDALRFVAEAPHPRLWRLLADHSLRRLDFATADKAFARCGDYQGLQFVRRVQALPDTAKQQAEVATYFRRFDDAERLYLDGDRADLAIALRARLGARCVYVHV